LSTSSPDRRVESGIVRDFVWFSFIFRVVAE
jgi:hypothetical protein